MSRKSASYLPALFLSLSVVTVYAGGVRCDVVEVTGMIVAYDGLKWEGGYCPGICEESVIVRVLEPVGLQPRYIRVDFKTQNQKYPKEMIESVRRNKPLRFKLIRTAGRDEPLDEFIYQGQSVLTPERKIPIWVIVSEAGGVRLPFGETIPSYALKKGGLKLVSGR